jgi:CBS domain-containing protein
MIHRIGPMDRPLAKEESMDVKTILRTKGRNVTTIQPDASVAHAAELLRQRNIGAVVVVEESGAVAGIISERDIVHGVAAKGSVCLEQKVAELMTRRVHSCRLEDSVTDLMGRMTEARIRHLPVLEDGRLCGIVSIGDVVKNRLEEIEFEAEQLREYVTTAG